MQQWIMAGVSGGSGGSMGPGLAGLLRLGFTTAALRRRGIRSFPTFDGWRLEIGDWNLEIGIWSFPPCPFRVVRVVKGSRRVEESSHRLDATTGGFGGMVNGMGHTDEHGTGLQP